MMGDKPLTGSAPLDKRLIFKAKGLKEYYARECQRTESILEQSSRLQIFQALFTAAYYVVIPSLYEYCGKIQWLRTTICVFSCGITILICLSLAYTLSVQWRYEYGVPPRLDKEKGEKYLLCGEDVEELESRYVIETYPVAIDVLEERNNKRIKLLKTATILFAIDIGLIVIISIGVIIFSLLGGRLLCI